MYVEMCKCAFSSLVIGGFGLLLDSYTRILRTRRGNGSSVPQQSLVTALQHTFFLALYCLQLAFLRRRLLLLDAALLSRHSVSRCHRCHATNTTCVNVSLSVKVREKVEWSAKKEGTKKRCLLCLCFVAMEGSNERSVWCGSK